jgi:NAD(P)-dependent dehydrogenase (short-subunit alcohol dehydrogenase family)
VFNNGAYACPGLVEDLPVEALQAIFQTNLFGWHDLTRRVLPVMRRQGGGRIVMNSSVLGFVGAPFRGAYVATKFALEGLSDVLRIELRGSGIHVVLIEPGPVTSRIRLNAIPHFERWIDWKASAQSARYAALLNRLYEGGHDRFELPASAVTARLVTALDTPRPRARYMVTTPTYVAAAMRRLLPTGLSDRILSR